MKLLVFQHIECEHPGIFRDYLAEDGIEYDAVELDAGDSIPDLSQYDALWVMGGPMDVWDVDSCPWLVAEKAAIRQWVKVAAKPYLGLCLGHQLLAEALGGECKPMQTPEIGIIDVHMTAAASSDPVFSSLPVSQKCLQWHSVQVTKAPANASILASSEVCENQAMRVGSNAWSMQFHVEIEPDTVMNWGEVPAYRDALVSTLGASALTDMNDTASKHMNEFLSNSRQLYKNFMTAIASVSGRKIC
jgi:GMP synthase-like glutamine amidotransferase